MAWGTALDGGLTRCCNPCSYIAFRHVVYVQDHHASCLVTPDLGWPAWLSPGCPLTSMFVRAEYLTRNFVAARCFLV